ncbi:TPA_asm: P overlapped [Hedera alphacytorhabdovirus 1]|nr:TPA_asm: P overlapped [Hedera alphacytorhabdovirus 1]
MNFLSTLHFVISLYWYFVQLLWTTTIAHSTIWTQVCFGLLTATPVLILMIYMMTTLKIMFTSLQMLVRLLTSLIVNLASTLRMLWNFSRVLQRFRGFR